jgi:hypothetical protein
VSAAHDVLQAVDVALGRGDLDAGRDLLVDALAGANDPGLRQALGTIHYLEDRFVDARREWEAAFGARRPARRGAHPATGLKRCGMRDRAVRPFNGVARRSR